MSSAALVLGMHRSGTSAVARLIGALGAALPADPNPPAPDNPEGYWEPAGVVAVNDRLLMAADSSWLDVRPLDLDRVPADTLLTLRTGLARALDRSFHASACYVLKDPRISRMVPLYRRVLADRGSDVRVVLVLRHPAAVAASLHRRNQLSPMYSAALWLQHVVEAELNSRDVPRIVVDYDDTLQNWRQTARRIGTLLDLPPRPDVEIDHAARPREELRHHAASAVSLPDVFRALYESVLALCAEDTPESRALVDARRSPCADFLRPLTNAMTAEFCVQRLTTPYPTAAAPDPVRERETMAAAFARLQQTCLEAGRAVPAERS